MMQTSSTVPTYTTPSPIQPPSQAVAADSFSFNFTLSHTSSSLQLIILPDLLVHLFSAPFRPPPTASHPHHCHRRLNRRRRSYHHHHHQHHHHHRRRRRRRRHQLHHHHHHHHHR